MDLALAEAASAAKMGEVPVGAVVVHKGKVISSAHNRREIDGDPSAHAEFIAMRDAAKVLGDWRLEDCTVYVTLEPCAMCAGLMVNARVPAASTPRRIHGVDSSVRSVTCRVTGAQSPV